MKELIIFQVVEGYGSGAEHYDRREYLQVGEKYKCISTYSSISSTHFDTGVWYKLVDYDKLSASFIDNFGQVYFLKTYTDATLFTHFDFGETYGEYLTRTREYKLESLGIE